MSDDDALNEISCFNHFFPKQMVLLETKVNIYHVLSTKKSLKPKGNQKYTILKTFK